MSNALRQHRAWERRRRGERVYRVAFRDRLVEWLIDLAFITEEEAADPAAVALAIANLAEAHISLKRRLG